MLRTVPINIMHYRTFFVCNTAFLIILLPWQRARLTDDDDCSSVIY